MLYISYNYNKGSDRIAQELGQTHAHKKIQITDQLNLIIINYR